jgi:hypothetical protein
MPNTNKKPNPQRRGALTAKQIAELNAKLDQSFENLNTEQKKPTGKILVRSKGASNIDESAASASAASASAASEANHGGAEVGVGGAEAFTGNTQKEEVWQERIARGYQAPQRRGAIVETLVPQGVDFNELAAAAQSSAAAGHGGGGGGGEAPNSRPKYNPYFDTNFVSKRAERAAAQKDKDAARRQAKSMDQSSLGAIISSARNESSSIKTVHRKSNSDIPELQKTSLFSIRLKPINGAKTNSMIFNR